VDLIKGSPRNIGVQGIETVIQAAKAGRLQYEVRPFPLYDKIK
jgi:hypothetical protein